MCCDEAMKLVTCLLILTIGYFCKKKDSGGEYSQISSRETGEKAFSAEESDDESVRSDANGANDANDEESETFLEHLRKELQFDWRMVCALVMNHLHYFYQFKYIAYSQSTIALSLSHTGWSGLTLHNTKESSLPSYIQS